MFESGDLCRRSDPVDFALGKQGQGCPGNFGTPWASGMAGALGHPVDGCAVEQERIAHLAGDGDGSGAVTCRSVTESAAAASCTVISSMPYMVAFETI